jgi:feruloyl esterase
MGHPDRLANYGHVAVHRTAETAKAIVRAYYGRAAQYSYFEGCSNGGRQALMEAQRYPQDFDGLLAGAPAYDFTSIAAGFVKNIKAVFPTRNSARTPVVTPDNLALIGRAALEACDASDGVRDGVIGAPDTCRFSLAGVKACPNETAAPDCLTTTERRAIAAIYAPATAGALQIYPGQPVGGENDESGWREWITGVDQGLLAGTNGQASSLQLAFAPELFKYMVFANPDWDYTTYDLANWARDTKAIAPILNADNPDLSPFKTHGGKLIIWHGWADPALNALSTVNYYARVQQLDRTSGTFMRLYLLPGVEHCNGGTGPARVDWLTAITDWVEKGKAPDRLVSSKMGPNGQPVRTRPLCPYPQRAVYKGSGSTDEEQNFVCR